MEGNNRPLALNSWVDMSGSNSYAAAIEAVGAAFASERNSETGHYTRLTSFIIAVLCDRIASQSIENYDQYQAVIPQLTTADTEFVRGNKRPAELVAFLASIDELPSIEIARRTLDASVEDTRTIIDTPVLADLDTTPSLQTKIHESAPLYRIKNLNLSDASDQQYIQVDRKQTVREHFGGKVLTVVRNSLVLHNDDKNLPETLQTIISDERNKARTMRRYDYDQHFEALGGHIEPYLSSTAQDRPTWLKHVLTTYYSARSEHIVAEPLTTFDD